MATAQKYGAYAEYSVAPGKFKPILHGIKSFTSVRRIFSAWTTFPLGPKTSFEDAATLPLAFMTAAIALFIMLGLPEPNSNAPSTDQSASKTIVIWGGGSSVGSFAVQLAKKSGLFV